MKTGTESKLKFRKLERRLRLAQWQVTGILESIWQFAANNCPRGDIGRFSDEDIAAGIGWEEDESILISALVETGWLDQCADHRLIVHDWHEHCPNYIKGNLASRKEEFVSRSPSPPLSGDETEGSPPLSPPPSEPLSTSLSDSLSPPANSPPPPRQATSSHVKSSHTVSAKSLSGGLGETVDGERNLSDGEGTADGQRLAVAEMVAKAIPVKTSAKNRDLAAKLGILVETGMLSEGSVAEACESIRINKPQNAGAYLHASIDRMCNGNLNKMLARLNGRE